MILLKGFFDPSAWNEFLTVAGFISLLSLSLLEIVLGIDNIIFISIVASKLPKNSQKKARVWGLSLALIFRIALLSVISWIAGLKQSIFSIGSFDASARDLILFAGGLFLVFKTGKEIYDKIEGDDEGQSDVVTAKSFTRAIIQIIILDLVFSFDSILTAVAISNNLVIMILAVVIAIIIMIVFAGYVSDFINKYQTIKMLALVFLIAIGFILIFDALHIHIPKEYVYVAMAFSLLVESLNLIKVGRAISRAKRGTSEKQK